MASAGCWLLAADCSRTVCGGKATKANPKPLAKTGVAPAATTYSVAVEQSTGGTASALSSNDVNGKEANAKQIHDLQEQLTAARSNMFVVRASA